MNFSLKKTNEFLFVFCFVILAQFWRCQWELRDSLVHMRGENQTAHHIIYHCEALRPPNSLDDLMSPGPDGVCWLDRLVGIAWGSLLVRKKFWRRPVICCVLLRPNICDEFISRLIEEGGDWDRRNRLKVYQGLYSIAIRDFKTAAVLFLETVSTFTSYELMDYETFVTYTVYVSMLALDRPQLRDKVGSQSRSGIAQIGMVPSCATTLRADSRSVVAFAPTVNHIRFLENVWIRISSEKSLTSYSLTRFCFVIFEIFCFVIFEKSFVLFCDVLFCDFVLWFSKKVLLPIH